MKSLLTVSLAFIAVLSSVSFSSSCSKRTDSIVVSYSPFESTALLWVAQNQQFFSRNGLDLTLRKYDSGAGALDGVINGEADIVLGTTEYPLVGRIFQGASISALASIARSEYIYVVARKDRGIEKVSDLKGKRIGTTFGTIAQFYLGRFLELNGVHMQDITLVEVKTPSEWVDAVVNGDIDAVCTAQPYANSAIERLGTNAASWSAQSHQPLYSLVIARDDWISGHSDMAVRFLKSLEQAEEYALHHSTESKAVVQKQLDLEPGYMETIWSQNQFGLSLDQSLILAMEDEARWMIANKLTTETQVPNFTDYIYFIGLATIKPEAVNIIR